MQLSDLHASVLSRAFERVLGSAEPGSMAFVRCLSSEVMQSLALSHAFSPIGWEVWRVASVGNTTTRTVAADEAVEIRETKGTPVLLLVDTARAGAGMDGIYSAAREVAETQLFKEAISLAEREVPRGHRAFAEQAVKKAKARSRRQSVSPWAEFDLLVRCAAEKQYPGNLLHLIGLWPIKEDETIGNKPALDMSVSFVNRLLGNSMTGATPSKRIEALRLLDPSDAQRRRLEAFVADSATKPMLAALADLGMLPELWINALRLEGSGQDIRSIELVSWRNQHGQIARWSGLEGGEEAVPTLKLKPDAAKTGDYQTLEIRWRPRPEHIEKGAVEYQVSLLTEMDEEIATREVSHSARKEEKCRFTNDDFATLSEDALVSARAVVSVIGNTAVEPKESEEFIICFGDPPEHETGGVGKKCRSFSEGLMELNERRAVTSVVSEGPSPSEEKKGYLLLRTQERGKNFRVFRPALIREVETEWSANGGTIGRWRIRVRAGGERADRAEFVPFARDEVASGILGRSAWDRSAAASRKLAGHFGASGGGVGQVYDDQTKEFENLVKEYLLSWSALLDCEEIHHSLALANTVEVQSLSGRTVGLIVLPSHPLRVAWHVAYDNLVLHARFQQGLSPKEVREELKVLDGAMFPAFLPGVDGEGTFVFADTLGFHAIGMVSDRDREPKAAVAILARALGDADTADAAPTVGKQSAEVLGREIIKYLGCHEASHLLHVHALRPGDGMTVARSLGKVLEDLRRPDNDDTEPEREESVPSFVLELYPSASQRGVSGRFISEVCERRRSGAGALSTQDRWMLESQERGAGITVPRLRWARREDEAPITAAHVAAAFDTFESTVATIPCAQVASKCPLFVFGLLSFFERCYTYAPSSLWKSYIPPTGDGEKHPSDPFHTKRLLDLRGAILKAVSRSLGATEASIPLLRTEISEDKADNLRTLHNLCDWVITVDRNAGVEYFDSPRGHPEIYDAYVIDCVPEREDLGCLQLVTSTSNLQEVRRLLDAALDQMGVSRSLRNAEFLMQNLKALSGRLAIRLTGNTRATGELIALALVHANCRETQFPEEAWTSLRDGFFIPADDVLDLLPPVKRGVVPETEGEARDTRPDLIHVSRGNRGGLVFRFVEVKYRRHLRSARSPEDLQHLCRQVESLKERWNEWYFGGELAPAQRAIRRAKLARVLRFYSDKARRHYLEADAHQSLLAEIDKMVVTGGDYALAEVVRGDRGFIFCPEYAGGKPLEISPSDWPTRVYLFGPGRLPDSSFRTASMPSPIPARLSEEGIEMPLVEENAPDDMSLSQKTPRDGMSQEGVAFTEGAAGPAVSAPTDGLEPGDTLRETLHIELGSDVLSNTPICWQPSTKGHPHLLMVGLSGMGKTTCLINICRQVKQQGVTPIVFSYHPDIDAGLCSILGDVRFVDYDGLGFNPLSRPADGLSRTFLDVAGEIRDIFLAIFPELGDIQGEALRQAIKESYTEQGWEPGDKESTARPDPPFGRFVEILRTRPKKDRGLNTLMARLQELEDYGFFRSGPGTGSLWESDLPVIIRIHTSQNENVQRAFASLLFYGFYKEMFYRKPQDHLRHVIVFDEAHRAARLKLIPRMAQECRKYGVGLVLASQQTRDFDPHLFSLIANYLILRLTDLDAKALIRNVTSSDQERALIDRIKQMDKYRALFFCEGRKRPACVALAQV